MKNVFITGASSGIGLATAELLASKGYRLALTARNAAKFETLSDTAKNNSILLTCDVRNAAQVREAIDSAVKHLGSLDAVINNAGLGYFDTLEEGNLDQWHEMVDTNVKGVLNVMHASLPHLIASTGHMINLGSVASHQVFANSGVYAATKHAVLALSESIRIELAGKLKVTTISPGSVDTPFIDKTTNTELLKTYKTYFAEGLKTEVVADAILYALESPGSSVVSEIIIRPNRAIK